MSFLGNLVGAEGCDGGPNPLGKLVAGLTQQPLQPRLHQPPPGAVHSPLPEADLLQNHQWDAEFATRAPAAAPAAVPQQALVAPPAPPAWLEQFRRFDAAASSSNAAAVVPGGNQLYHPAPVMPTFASPAAPATATAPEVQVFGDAVPYEQKKEQSSFFEFMGRVKKGDVVLRGKEMFERQADGTFPAEMYDLPADAEEATVANPFLSDWSMDDQLQRLQEAALADTPAAMDDWISEYRNMSQRLDEYPLEQENSFKYHDNAFEEGLKLLEAGNLPEAALRFEADVARHPDHAEGWQYLGTTQASNERDPRAVLALRRCLQLQPNNLTALLAMAVSQTNEGNHHEAVAALETWLNNNPKYEGLPVEPPQAVEEEHMFWVNPEQHQALVRRLQRAAALGSDPDVHIGLGVMHHMVHNFDDAIVNFQTALQLQPGDARLWNKLGATLANSSRNAEAVVAYNQALDLNPGFVRAQYNLGIAYTNMSQHAEAAQHFLRAIAMQTASAPQHERARAAETSAEMWNVLRSSFTFMGRPDLVERSQSNDISF
eukprot:TRINITY_DN9627_c0_g1_i1.p1 TRINITY_DN9627_c0_g1~~TRINITY_DN9627_c0_g1_i1.p1  ORF type:complete len:562 (-),score=176.50 TRINITY_DN9627_c0_g1_i1:56-1690(-)